MILDRKLFGILDQGKGHLIVYDSSENDDNYGKGEDAWHLIYLSSCSSASIGIIDSLIIVTVVIVVLKPASFVFFACC